MQSGTISMDSSLENSQMIRNEPSLFLLEICLKETNTPTQIDLSIPTFVLVLFKIAQTWKVTRYVQ